MQVLVTGGTGFIGTYLCEELADRGHDVTALARDPDETDFDADVETVRGDVTDPGSLMDPFEGQDAVVNLVALSPLFKPSGGEDRQFEVHLGGTENCIEAAEANDVDKFVQQSALGADPDAPTAYLRAKGEAELVVKNSRLDWVVLEPSIIFGEGGEFVPFTRMLAPPYLTPLPAGGTNPFQPIWVEEFVQMAADAVEGTVTGPRADGGGRAAPRDTAPPGRDAEEPSDEAAGADETDDTGPGADDAETTSAAADRADTVSGTDDPHVGNVYQIGGPEVLTMAEVAELAWAERGKPVSVVPIPMALTRLGLTVLDLVPGAPFGLDQYRSLGVDNTTERNAIGAFGWEPDDLTTLSSYLGVSEADIGR